MRWLVIRSSDIPIGLIPSINSSAFSRKAMTQSILKRIFDVAIAIAILALVWPLLVLISVLIKMDSSGPVHFVQDRIGKDGVIFRMYKFRTMVLNAEHTGTRLCSYPGDPRVTRLGKYLRF